MRVPSIQALETAAEWLRCNEGDEGEAEDCHAVADWLSHRADLKLQQEVTRDVARETGLRAAEVRRRVKQFERGHS